MTRTTTTGYDSRGRFPTSTTYPSSASLNPVVLSETRVFDARFGIAIQVTDANGMFATKLVDGFGRVFGERTYNAAGQKVGETYSPVETAGLSGNEKYRQRQKASGGGEVEVYHDELQREVRRRSKAFIDATYATTTLAYDAAGCKVTASKPAGGGMVTTAWTYDALNRLASETMTGTGLSLTSSYAYGVTPSLTVEGSVVGPLKSVSITQSGSAITGRTQVKYTNSQGQTVRVSDGLGNPTDFVYDAIGNLLKAIGPTGIAETMTYDLRGRKVTLANPDSGSWSYEYNGAGELVRQTDAKGQVTRDFHDSLGRVVERREHPGSEATTPFVTVTSYDRYATSTLWSDAPILGANFGRARTSPSSIRSGVLVKSSTRRSRAA